MLRAAPGPLFYGCREHTDFQGWGARAYIHAFLCVQVGVLSHTEAIDYRLAGISPWCQRKDWAIWLGLSTAWFNGHTR